MKKNYIPHFLLLVLCLANFAQALAEEPQRPNILFIVVDDQSPFDLKCYNPNSILETPNIDRLVREGMVFDGAYHMGSFSGAVCTPSRHMIMSGRTVWHLPISPKAMQKGLCPPNLEQQSLPAVFNRAGYATMRTCKQGNSYEAANKLFTVRHDATKRGGTPQTGSAWHGDRVMEYLADRKAANDTKPFLIYFGFSHPHDERDGTPELLDKYGSVNHTDQDNPPPSNPRQPALPNNYLPAHPFHHGHPELRDEVAVSGVWQRRDERTIRNELGRQFACCENIDNQIGRVLNELETMGELDNTYIVYTSDHGMAIGRHGLQGKQNLYQHTWRVPFIVRGPGIRPGSRAEGNIYLLDLLATFCDLAGIAPPDTNEGLSFKSVLHGQQSTVRDVLYGVYNGGTKPGMRSVKQGDWKLIKYDVMNGSVRQTQLFNLKDNPDELLAEHHDPAVCALNGASPEKHQTNLAADPQHAAKLKELEGLLLAEMRRLDDPWRLWDQPADGRAPPPERPGRAANGSQPNILFAIADDWGFHAGCYGTQWVKTPSFDRIAREGLLFNNAYTPMAKCAPSRAIILTGRHLWQNEEAGNHMAMFPQKLKSWPEVLQERGWHMGITGKGWGPGIAKDASGKPRLITGKQFDQRKADPPTNAIGNNDYAANFVDFLDATPQGAPWCFWYGCTEPHRGYEFQSGVRQGGKRLEDVERVPGYWPDNETVRHDMLDYAFEVEHMDDHLGRMMAELEKRGQLDNTLIIVTSDHGMPFPRVKGFAYHDSNHVPLAIRWPQGVKHPGRVIDDFVDFTDIAATLFDYAGIGWDGSGMMPLTGKSWRPIISSALAGRVVPERDHVLIGKERTDVGRPYNWGYPIRGIVTADYLYLHNAEPTRWPAGNPETGYLDTDGSPTKSLILELGRADRANRLWQLNFGMRPADELYDLRTDKDCVHNMATGSGELVRGLRQRMETMLKAQGDPRMLGQGQIFDSYVPTNGDGFYEKYLRGEKVSAGWVNPTDFEK